MARPLTHIPSANQDQEPDSGVLTDVKPKTERPPLYKVLLINDDYTPMDFVVHVLEMIFGMEYPRAVALMLTVHQTGHAIIGVFSREVAETKVSQVMEYAQHHGHPLQCTMEKEL